MKKELHPALQDVKADHAKWEAEAAKVASDGNPLNVPYAIALSEAASVAGFIETYWDAKDGARGLSSVAKRLPRHTSRDIVQLVLSVQRAQTDYLLATSPALAENADRAAEVIDTLESALDFLLDDDVHEPADDQLAAIHASHANDGANAAEIAQALRDYAALAKELEMRLVAVDESFDPKLIHEATTLADALTKQPATPPKGDAGQKAKSRRDKLLTLLTAKVNLARQAARYVFRARPEIARLATSAYERRRRAEARRAKAKKAAGAAAKA